MSDTDLNQQLLSLWTKAVESYSAGQHNPQGWAKPQDLKLLNRLGINPSEIYDFAEDFCQYGEPDPETFLAVHRIRIDYFQKVQMGKRSSQVVDPDSLPERSAAAGGFPWLPRIIAKASAKLRGELPPDIMYGCGGDRGFLEEHGFTAEQFLAAVRDLDEDHGAMVDWVTRHSQQAQVG